MKVKAGGKALIIAAIIGGCVIAANHFGYFESRTTTAATVPTKLEIPSGESPPVGTSTVNLPPANSNYQVKVLTMAWNTFIGLAYANGGVTTASGSIMAKHGVNVIAERQDDYSAMTAQQVAFAKSFAGGNPNPSEGAAFVVIMGGGFPAYAAATNEAMAKLGQSVQVIGSIGYSRGEDKCMLPAKVKANPQLARGSLIGGVERDDDLHLCFKWAKDNSIPINADHTTYDPDAMNFIAVDAFTQADEKLIAGYSETRPVVHNGKLTGEKATVMQNGTATWTPGDVKVTTECAKPGKQCAGITAVASSAQYKFMIPAVVIGNKAWMEKNPALVQNFLAAAFEGGEIVRTDDTALLAGASVESKIFKEEAPAYWAKYFKGENGLGGSTTSGLGDNAHLFGLNGNDSIYKRVYTVLGNLDHEYYPASMPSPLPYSSVVNTSYIEALLSKSTNTVKADTGTFVASAPVTGTFARKAYGIEFQSGKSTFTPEAATVLDDVLNQISTTGLYVQVNGHTDNIGNPQSNLALSKARADAVKGWIMQNSPANFPDARIKARGYGDGVPIADNKTAAGKSKNRRVEILLLETN